MSDKVLAFDIGVSGSTASGKSEFAELLAANYSGAVVNCDSVQVYKDHKVGGAIPGAEIRKKTPHHLFEIFEGDTDNNAAVFLDILRSKVNDVVLNHQMPIISGGSTMYFQAFINGLTKFPVKSIEFRELKKTVSNTDLYNELVVCDPVRAEELHRNDRMRIIRSLEICHLSGKTFQENISISTENKKQRPTLMLILVWPRDILYDRINLRTNNMLDNGLVEETERLTTAFGENWRSQKALGYHQVLEYLKGDIKDRSELTDKIAQQTRKFAKRQMTFWRNAPKKLLWKTAPSINAAHSVIGNEQKMPERKVPKAEGFPCYDWSFKELILEIDKLELSKEECLVWYLNAKALFAKD